MSVSIENTADCIENFMRKMFQEKMLVSINYWNELMKTCWFNRVSIEIPFWEFMNFNDLSREKFLFQFFFRKMYKSIRNIEKKDNSNF